MIGFIVPAIAAGLIIFAAIDIYRHRNNDPRKSKRKNDDYYVESDADYEDDYTDEDDE